MSNSTDKKTTATTELNPTITLSTPITTDDDQTIAELTVKEVDTEAMIDGIADLDQYDQESGMIAVTCGVPLSVIDELSLTDYQKAGEIFQQLNTPKMDELTKLTAETAQKEYPLHKEFKTPASVKVQKVQVQGITVKLSKQAQRTANGNAVRTEYNQVAYALHLVPEDLGKMAWRDYMAVRARFQLVNYGRTA